LRFAQIVFLDPQNAPKSLAAGLRPRPHWGSLQRSPDPLAGLRGHTSKGPTSKGRGGEGRGFHCVIVLEG